MNNSNEHVPPFVTGQTGQDGPYFGAEWSATDQKVAGSSPAERALELLYLQVFLL